MLICVVQCTVLIKLYRSAFVNQNHFGQTPLYKSVCMNYKWEAAFYPTKKCEIFDVLNLPIMVLCCTSKPACFTWGVLLTFTFFFLVWRAARYSTHTRVIRLICLKRSVEISIKNITEKYNYILDGIFVRSTFNKVETFCKPFTIFGYL